MVLALPGVATVALLALVALGALGAGQEPGPVDWAAVWQRLAEVRAAHVAEADPGPALESLRSIAEERDGEARGAMLGIHLARLEDPDRLWEPGVEWLRAWPFRGEETWLAAEVLGPSPERALALRRALEAHSGSLSPERLVLAWGAGVEEARAQRLTSARGLQEVLHAKNQAVWSAMDLSLTLSRLGEAALADRVLADQIEREAAAGRPTGDLWARRGTQALGIGDEPRARDYLGHGLARGSANSGVVLARLDLLQGRLEEARAGFRALLLSPDPSPWAPRGWGLSLLPPPSTDRTAAAGDR